jgi:hypothetical protein
MNSGEGMLKSVRFAAVRCGTSHGNDTPLCISEEQHLCRKGRPGTRHREIPHGSISSGRMMRALPSTVY